MKQIAIYGKGGIGKSSTASNVAAACADDGYSVTIVGCDPKSDSSITLLGGHRIPTVMELMQQRIEITEKDVVFEGYKGIRCVEVGGPEPGIGCAGRGIIVAIKMLQKISTVMQDCDLIIYDVPGDIVCGGFAAPIRKGLVNDTYVLTSGEYMPLYAANNICKGFARLGNHLNGVICNSRIAENEEAIVSAFARELGSELLAFIPKDPIVQTCERAGFSVIEKEPDSEIAEVYRKLARTIIERDSACNPIPLTDARLRELTGKSSHTDRS